MTNANNNMTLADFERLLEVYGSDRTRWPADARAGAGHLVARDRAARRLLVEAEALDRALERAPLPSLALEAALADRIAAAAPRSPRIVRSGGAPAAQAPAEGRSNVFRLPDLRGRRQWRGRTALGGAASVLAASLAIGVLIGLSSLPQPLAPAALQELSSLLGERGTHLLAQVDPLDEDLL
jgi:hypothetical protein